MAILNPSHLIDQARKLVAPPAAGRPLQVDLRRAISASYYAVFHAVVAAVADHYVGKKHRQTAHYGLVYRSVDHRRLKKVCRDLSQSGPPKDYGPLAPPGGLGRNFVTFAAIVVDLQERRHAADYDPLKTFVTADAISAIKAAEVALRRFDALDPVTHTIVLSLLVFLPRPS